MAVDRRVTLLHMGEENSTYLADLTRSDCELSFHIPLNSCKKESVALLAQNGRLKYLAWIESSKRADDIRRRLALTEIFPLFFPLSLEQALHGLSRQQLRRREAGGTLSPDASRAVLETLVNRDGRLGPVIDAYFARDHVDVPVAREEQLMQERDACASALAFANMSLDGPIIEQDESISLLDRVTFLPDDNSGYALEDPMIAHDAQNFLGWSSRSTDKLGVAHFRDDAGRDLHIMNINRQRSETATGADLLFHHKQRDSFVLVQYKRMRQQGERYVYHANEALVQQLVKMRTLDSACKRAAKRSAPTSTYRLHAAPSFVKICRMDRFEPHEATVISGMCMPQDQVRQHIDRGNTAFTYEAGFDYLTSSLFAELVASGHVGSHPGASGLIRGFVSGALDRGASVVLGTLNEPKSRRASGPRRSATRVEHGGQLALL